MQHIYIGLEIIQFYFSSCVYDEYLINLSYIKMAAVLNFQIDVHVFKLVHVNGCILRGCSCAHSAFILLGQSINH